MKTPASSTHEQVALPPRWPERGRVWLRAPVPGLCLCLLAACSGTLLPPPAATPARFTLSGAAGRPVDGLAPSGAPLITVELPRAAPGHDSRRMLYQRHPQQPQAFAFHEWVEPPALMLAPMLVRSLQDSARFPAVLSASSASSASAQGWRLETESLLLLQDFTVRPSQVRMAVRAVLLDNATRQVIAWQTFDVSVAAARDDPVAGAAAAQDAAQQLAAAVTAFCAAQAKGPRRARADHPGSIGSSMVRCATRTARYTAPARPRRD